MSTAPGRVVPPSKVGQVVCRTGPSTCHPIQPRAHLRAVCNPPGPCTPSSEPCATLCLLCSGGPPVQSRIPPMPRRSVSDPGALCVGPPLSLSRPDAICRGPALSVSTFGALCVGPRRSLRRAVSGPGDLCVGLSVLGPGALCVRPQRSLYRPAALSVCRATALCVGPRRSLCRAPALSESGPGASCVQCRGPTVSASRPAAFCVGPRRTLCVGPRRSVRRVHAPSSELRHPTGPHSKSRAAASSEPCHPQLRSAPPAPSVSKHVLLQLKRSIPLRRLGCKPSQISVSSVGTGHRQAQGAHDKRGAAWSLSGHSLCQSLSRWSWLWSC